jgi:hypothetical protein
VRCAAGIAAAKHPAGFGIYEENVSLPSQVNLNVRYLMRIMRFAESGVSIRYTGKTHLIRAPASVRLDYTPYITEREVAEAVFFFVNTTGFRTTFNIQFLMNSPDKSYTYAAACGPVAG